MFGKTVESVNIRDVEVDKDKQSKKRFQTVDF